MITLIGPCIVAAPLVGVLAILALPLWPVAIVLVGLVRLLFWPVQAIASAMGATWAKPWTEGLAAAFRFVLRPWSFFDPPKA